MANTGLKIYTTLKKVVNGGPHDGEALDVNNQLVSVTGLPQHTKPNSGIDHVDAVIDLDMCSLTVATTDITVVNSTIEIKEILIVDLVTGEELVNAFVDINTEVFSVVSNSNLMELTIYNSPLDTINYTVVGSTTNLSGTITPNETAILTNVAKEALTITLTQ